MGDLVCAPQVDAKQPRRARAPFGDERRRFCAQRRPDAHPVGEQPGAHGAHAHADLVEVVVVHVEAEVGDDGVAVALDGVASRVIDVGDKHARTAAVQRTQPQAEVGHLLKVVLPYVVAGSRLKVLILADGARVGRGEYLAAQEDKRRHPARARQMKLVQNALDLREEAVVVVVAHDEEHVDYARCADQRGARGHDRRHERRR
mmetsp:Transcript_13947/g.30002  ORF Transcript_13947/g.30002 Transcript_13947/m.30002 type:complete len:203 (-) Transcript_13947:118-726(-)